MKVLLLLHLTAIVALSCIQARNLPSYAPGNLYDQYECQVKSCPFGYFNCDCEKSREVYLGGLNCIPSSWMCDGQADCADGSDELECTCNENELQCSLCSTGSCSGNITLDLYQCVNEAKTRDGEQDCLSKKDEEPLGGRNCVLCDGIIDCPYRSPNDEANCSSCPSETPNRCKCNSENGANCQGNGHVCFKDSARCDGIMDCTDASDEANCNCQENEFHCQCNRLNPPTCLGNNSCIPIALRNDGDNHCPDGSDETQFKRVVQCDHCNVTVYRFNDENECRKIGLPKCDPDTCFRTTSLSCVNSDCNIFEFICTSHCSNSDGSCKRGFQCSDGTLAVAAQFCDGTYDCPDDSDEVSNQLGFTCIKSNRSCVLPQRNLWDQIPQCPDETDLCLSQSCFQCLDNRQQILSSQVCDGIVNCNDLSDECLCSNADNNPVCSDLGNTSTEACDQVDENNVDTRASSTTSSTITCQTKWGAITANLCDGRPECKDFSDECNCPNKPGFCFDECAKYYELGDRYCDGLEDDAYLFINKSECPKGFDETNCPKRFSCKSGPKVSIDISKVCDGIPNCDDGSDEKICDSTAEVFDKEKLFSSNSELLMNSGLAVGVWIMAMLAILGNLAVIYKTMIVLKYKLTRFSRFQYAILLNIAICDLIMGFYLLAVAIQSSRFSVNYSEIDLEWRSSPGCSTIGSFAFISAETSCLLMVLLTSFTLFYLWEKPEEKKLRKTKKFLGFGIVTSWIIGIFLAILPLLGIISTRFVQTIVLDNPINQKSLWNVEDFKQQSCRLAKLSDKVLNIENWKTISSFLEDNFPEYAPVHVLGYYAGTSICMPKMYLGVKETAWQYFLGIISVNFVLYLFISICYVFILSLELQKKLPTENQQNDMEEMIIIEREIFLQRRIGSIIFTNVLFWIIIAIIAYASAGGVIISKYTYETTLAVLIPINSVLNPILNLSLDMLFRKFRFEKKKEETEVSSKEE